MAADPTLLALTDVRAGYAEVEVLRGVSLRVQAGHIVSIIGANGAGKSTLLRTVFGMVRPHAGSIVFAGKDVTGLPPTEILRIGIGYVPQGRCNFPAMSVQENLEMGAYLRDDANVVMDIEATIARFPMLGDRRRAPAGAAPKPRRAALAASAYNPSVTRTMNPVHETATCAVAACAEIIGAKWTALLVHDLSEGPRRFSQLERSCSGISPRTLAERLRALEQEGMLARQSFVREPA